MVIEPWFLNATVLKQHGIILDEQNQRVFFVGKQATQIWILNCDYSSCQYIWYGGMEDESWKISPSIYLRIDRTTLTRQGWKVEGGRTMHGIATIWQWSCYFPIITTVTLGLGFWPRLNQAGCSHFNQ